MSPATTLDFHSYQRLVRALGPPWMAWFAPGERAEEEIGFAVHAAFLDGRLVVVRNRARRCWELPGGRREPGEGILQTARRELAEECGAVAVESRVCCGYSVRLGERLSHGILCLTRLEELPGPPPISEIGVARAVTELPGPLCYPHIQGRLLEALVTGRIPLPWPAQLPGLPTSLKALLASCPPPLGRFPVG